MHIAKRNWIVFGVLAVLGLALWFKFGFSQFAFVDLSVDKKKAVNAAEDYLTSIGIDPNGYYKSAVFIEDVGTDRYLQRTLGFEGEADFVKQYGYDLFVWAIRFFKPEEKEEYRVLISSQNGKVISFHHSLEDTQKIPTLSQDAARKKAEEFLTQFLKVNLAEYDVHEEKIKRFENRTDYAFVWAHKDVYIPWGEKKDGGGAKLLSGATVTGNRIGGFYSRNLDIPEKFNRFVEGQFALGKYIGNVSFLLIIILIGLSVLILVRRRNDLIMYVSKKWYIGLGISLFILGTLSIFNNFQSLLFGYKTSQSMSSYFGDFLVTAIFNILFLSMAFMLPGLSAESLRQEVYPQNKDIAFFHFINSDFLSRTLSKMIILGYLLFFVLIGLQAALFALGQRYLGVWVERTTLVEMSSSYLPFLAALVIGYRASFNEEILFRLFGISLGKKYFRNSVLAVVISSLIWGFGHSVYAVFPVWFRGIEVSIMGLVLGYIFLRYGIITAIVGHYIFDVFWGVAPYILGRATPYLFYSALCVMLLPLLIAIIAYLKNGREEERRLEWLLNQHQKFNLEVLIDFLTHNKGKLLAPDKLRLELIEHGWDVSVVDLAIKKVNHTS